MQDGKTYFFSDGTIDRDGDRLLPEGCVTEHFLKNPVALYSHKKTSPWMDAIVLPVGNWKNLVLENGKWKAQIEWNSSELGQALKQLEDEGQTFSTSVGYLPIAFSNEPALMLPGQKWATTTSWELLEISICTVQSNRNAVQQKSFSATEKQIFELGTPAFSQKSLDLIDSIISKSFQNPNTMTELFKKLQAEVKGDLDSIKALVDKAIKGAKPDEKAATEEIGKEFTGKVEAIEKKLGELQTENESISTAKDAAEASVKTLTTEKETLTSEKAALVTDKETLAKRVKELEDSEKELKAANLKLSGGTETPETPVVGEKQKNDEVPVKGPETDAQKTARLMKSLEGIDKIV